jgi:hypothetical protein
LLERNFSINLLIRDGRAEVEEKYGRKNALIILNPRYTFRRFFLGVGFTSAKKRRKEKKCHMFSAQNGVGRRLDCQGEKLFLRRKIFFR